MEQSQMPDFRPVWSFVAAALIGGGFYLLLIDITGLPELYTLAAAAIASAVTGVLAREQGVVEALVLPWWLLRSWRLTFQIPQDIGIVCWEALAQLLAPRRVRGTFRAHSFGATEQSPPAMGRRALVEAVGSVAPNTIVIGIDEKRGLLLVHQLRRQGAASEIDVTGLG
jgi:hypothetical protein